MSDLAARKADLDFELAQAKTEACLNAIYKEHPELVVCAANTKMLVEYCREGFGEPTMENLRIAVADPNSGLARKTPVDLKNEVEAEAARIHKIPPGQRSADAARRRIQPPVVLKHPQTGAEISKRAEVLALSADDLKRVMNRGKSHVDGLNEILAGGK